MATACLAYLVLNCLFVKCLLEFLVKNAQRYCLISSGIYTIQDGWTLDSSNTVPFILFITLAEISLHIILIQIEFSLFHLVIVVSPSFSSKRGYSTVTQSSLNFSLCEVFHDGSSKARGKRFLSTAKEKVNSCISGK